VSVAAAPPEEAAPARRPRPSLDERLAAAGARVPLYLFLGALLVQLVYLSQYAVSPFFWVPELDQVYHDLCARQIVAGHLDPRPYFRAPLYVYLLGGVYAVFGRSFWAARLVQAVMQAAAVVLLWRLGRRAGVRPSVAAAAGTMMALSGPLVFAAGELHTPGVELFCNVLLLNLAVAPPANPARCPLWALAAGLALGLSGVARPTVLTTAPVLLWWLWARWTVPADGPRRPTRFALLAALYLLGAAVAPGAATWRNYRTAGDPVIVASQGPINLWIGNRDYADGFTSSTPRRYRFDGEYEDSVALFAQRAAEEATGHRMTVTETERYWTAETLKWVRAHPAMTLGLAWKKWVLLWGHREVRNNTAFEYVRREWAPVLWLLPFGMGIVGPLALVGIALAWRRDPPLRMLSLWALVYLAGYLPFFVADRYRLPAVPVLILLAAHALVWLAGRLRARGRRVRQRQLVGHGPAADLGAGLLELRQPLRRAAQVPRGRGAVPQGRRARPGEQRGLAEPGRRPLPPAPLRRSRPRLRAGDPTRAGQRQRLLQPRHALLRDQTPRRRPPPAGNGRARRTRIHPRPPCARRVEGELTAKAPRTPRREERDGKDVALNPSPPLASLAPWRLNLAVVQPFAGGGGRDVGGEAVEEAGGVVPLVEEKSAVLGAQEPLGDGVVEQGEQRVVEAGGVQ
jgi:4-amino-4-deoxy-L-arabinose transferase-like glycosyltransferase